MSDNPYERVKGGRLAFKGGGLATRSKTIDKKNKKKQKTEKEKSGDEEQDAIDALNEEQQAATTSGGGGEVIYTIDAAKKMKYEDLFPVEAKKFGYDPKAKTKSVEEALDDRVKKKADRCVELEVFEETGGYLEWVGVRVFVRGLGCEMMSGDVVEEKGRFDESS
ncbi:hypothetical protein Cgig2_012857 [Carnegiea gigantea]|uniref:Uncharacterized protein n=1 Tax=Carnegiea gigantea TaxID=171969 RepID=A0A9Q1Q9D5_9CARY|nr:hypothetical protein Cgig2_012857 [Carnegiea gigantea]